MHTPQSPRSLLVEPDVAEPRDDVTLQPLNPRVELLDKEDGAGGVLLELLWQGQRSEERRDLGVFPLLAGEHRHRVRRGRVDGVRIDSLSRRPDRGRKERY